VAFAVWERLGIFERLEIYGYRKKKGSGKFDEKPDSFSLSPGY